MVSASEFISEDKGLFNVFVDGFLPSTAVIPIGYFGDDYHVNVKVGDNIQEGQQIACSNDICTHSSIPGVVTDISSEEYDNGKQGAVVKVKLGGEFSFVGKKSLVHEWKNYDSESLCYMIRDYGVANTFKECSPLFPKVKNNLESEILAVRLFDEDPSRVSESFISEKLSKKVIEGTAVFAKASSVSAVVFLYEKNNSSIRKCYESLNNEESDSFLEASDLFGDIKFISVPVDVKKYPSGTMHNIVSATKNFIRSFSKKKKDLFDIFQNFGVKDYFLDSYTVVSIYDSIVLRKPVMSRYVHITGECLNAAAIMNVKIGTPLKQIVEQCGGFKKQPSKIIINGIVTGYAVSSLNIPVTKQTKSVEFIPDNQISIQHSEVCVRCGHCRKICPVHIWPGNLYRIFNMSNEYDFQNVEKQKELLDASKICIECGLCNSVCPSRIPLCQTMVLAKKIMED